MFFQVKTRDGEYFPKKTTTTSRDRECAEAEPEVDCQSRHHFQFLIPSHPSLVSSSYPQERMWAPTCCAITTTATSPRRLLSRPCAAAGAGACSASMRSTGSSLSLSLSQITILKASLRELIHGNDRRYLKWNEICFIKRREVKKKGTEKCFLSATHYKFRLVECFIADNSYLSYGRRSLVLSTVLSLVLAHVPITNA